MSIAATVNEDCPDHFDGEDDARRWNKRKTETTVVFLIELFKLDTINNH